MPLAKLLAGLDGKGLLLPADELFAMVDRLDIELNRTSQTEPRTADLLIPSPPTPSLLTPATPSSVPIRSEPDIEETRFSGLMSCNQTPVVLPRPLEPALDATDAVPPESIADRSHSSAPVAAQDESETQLVATTSELRSESSSDRIAKTTAESSVAPLTETDAAAFSNQVASQALDLIASEPVIDTRSFETETAEAEPAKEHPISIIVPAETTPIHPEPPVVANHETGDTGVDLVAPSRAAPLFMHSTLARLLLARPTPSADTSDVLEAAWEETLSIRCPTCHATQHPATECRRCKCDLSLQRMCIEQQLQLRQRILRQIYAGHYPSAAHAAWLLLQLSSDADTLRLVAVTQLLAGDFATAVSLVDKSITA